MCSILHLIDHNEISNVTLYGNIFKENNILDYKVLTPEMLSPIQRRYNYVIYNERSQRINQCISSLFPRLISNRIVYSYVFYYDQPSPQNVTKREVFSVKKSGVVSYDTGRMQSWNVKVDDIIVTDEYQNVLPTPRYGPFFLKKNKYTSRYFNLYNVLPEKFIAKTHSTLRLPDSRSKTFDLKYSNIQIQILRIENFLEAFQLRKPEGEIVVWVNYTEALGRKLMLGLHKALKEHESLKNNINFLTLDNNGIKKFSEMVEQGHHILSVQTEDVGEALDHFFFKEGDGVRVNDKGLIELSTDVDNTATLLRYIAPEIKRYLYIL